VNPLDTCDSPPIAESLAEEYDLFVEPRAREAAERLEGKT
jgi:hypothetical protein